MYMGNIRKEDCRYFLEGKCQSVTDLIALRGNDCKNEVKDACCHTCKLIETCEISCDFLEVKDRETEDIQFLMEDELIKARYDILLKMYSVMGVLLFTIGVIFIILIESLGNYWELIEFYWRLYALTRSPQLFLALFATLLPLILVILGLLLISYGAIKGRKVHYK